jgi:hypothetical protein
MAVSGGSFGVCETVLQSFGNWNCVVQFFMVLGLEKKNGFVYGDPVISFFLENFWFCLEGYWKSFNFDVGFVGNSSSFLFFITIFKF